MRLVYLLFCCGILAACSSEPERNATEQPQTELQPTDEKLPAPSFDFDEIIHYSVKGAKENKYVKAYSSDREWEKEEFHQILIGTLPDSLTDPNFLSLVEEMGYWEKEVPKKQYQKIRDIFTPRHTFRYATECIPIYRDILIFKKSDEVTGISKVCFTCDQNYSLRKENNLEERFYPSIGYLKLFETLYGYDFREEGYQY